jgi:hypothetical protein
MTFSNPMGRTSKARGSSVNLSGKQKAEISHEQEMGGNGTTSMARKSKAKAMLMPPMLAGAGAGASTVSAPAPMVAAKKGGVIPTRRSLPASLLPGAMPGAPAATPPLMGATGPVVGAKFGGRVPTQNAMLRAARKPKDEEAGESKKTEAKEVAAGSEPKLKDGGNWIAGAIGKPGALHRDLGVPEGEKIPAGKLASAEKKKGAVGKRARLAATLESFHK